MWSRIPLVRLIIPFIAGIITAENMPVAPAPILWASAAVVIGGGIFYGLLFGYGTKWIYGITIILFMFLAGYEFLDRKQESGEVLMESVLPGEKVYLLKTTDAFQARERSYRVSGELQGVRDSLDCSGLKGNIMIYAEPDSLLLKIKPGSYLLVFARVDTISPPANPSEFNYKKYLSRKAVYHSAYIERGRWRVIREKSGNGIVEMAASLRMNLLGKLFDHGITGRNFGVSSALLLGDDSHLDAGIRDIYARAGAMHILCVSGLHVGVVFLVLGFIFGFMKRSMAGRIFLPLILMLGIWSYALITGLAPPVVRASCMISFFIIGDVLKRHKNAYNTLAASALLMLLFDPELIFAAGFQLSYAAVLGILSLQRPIYNLVYFKPRLMDKVWSITAVSVAAQLGTLAIVLHYFHQFPLYSLITNLIVIPLSSLIIYAGMLFFVLPAQTMAAEAASWLLDMLVTAMDRGVAFVEEIPYGMLEGIHMDLIMTILIALFIGLISITIIAKRKQTLFMALVVLLLLSLYRISLHYKASQQHAFIVYSVRGHSAYDVVLGKDHTFYADSALLASEGKIEYSIEPNWLALNLNHPIPHTLNIKRYTLNVKRKRVLVWNEKIPSVPPEKKLSLDYLIIRGNIAFDINDVFMYFDPDLVIMDSSIPPWIEAPEGDDRFYDVRKSGAFVSD